VCVLAEIGVNHDGDPTLAERLIDAAAEAGADAVKLQLFSPQRLLSREAGLAEYQKTSESDVAKMLARLALDLDSLQQLGERARSHGMRFALTPFSPDDVAELDAAGADLVKIASPDAVNTPLLRAVEPLGRPVVVSTGACELDELSDAADLAARTGGALLQCVSSYPTPLERAGLGGIAALREAYPDLCVGYSDHTSETCTGAWAVAAGACVLEKHVTYDRAAAGPDHAASLDSDALAEYIRLARQAAAALGPRAKRCLDVEDEVRRLSRQSVCAARDLPAGRVLTQDDLTVKRPGTGLPARELFTTIGRTVARPVARDTPLRADDLC